jgi:hypothetical protein
LYLNLATTEGLDEILGRAHDFLIGFVSDRHIQFLSSIGESPSEIRQWHRRFDLNSVPRIPPVELARPEIPKQMTITESLEMHLPPRESVSVIPPSEQAPVVVPKSCQNLSAYFTIAKRVQEKIALKGQMQDLVNNQQITELLSLSDLLNSIFCGKKKSILSLPDVLANLAKTDAFRGAPHSRLIPMITELVSKSEGYFRTLELRGLSYLQVDSSQTYQHARGPIVRCVTESVGPPMPPALPV